MHGQAPNTVFANLQHAVKYSEPCNVYLHAASNAPLFCYRLSAVPCLIKHIAIGQAPWPWCLHLQASPVQQISAMQNDDFSKEPPTCFKRYPCATFGCMQSRLHPCFLIGQELCPVSSSTLPWAERPRICLVWWRPIVLQQQGRPGLSRVWQGTVWPMIRLHWRKNQLHEKLLKLQLQKRWFLKTALSKTAKARSRGHGRQRHLTRCWLI